MAFQASVEVVSALGRVAVIMGGASAERAVSLKSGSAVLKGLCDAGVDAFAIDYQGDMTKLTEHQNIDRAFLAVHGRGGEDGTLQAALEILGIPYTGTGVMGSALAMDKMRTKCLWLGMNLPTPKFVFFDASQRTLSELQVEIEALGFPLAIKPSREGSSIGVFKVNSAEALDAAIKSALAHDSQILIEQWIEGSEYTIAILKDKALPVIGLKTDHIFYDYDAKYESDSTQYLLPSGLSSEQEQEVQALSLQAFDALGCIAWGRIDVMQSCDGRFWLLEANTIPGMTDHSLVPMAAEAAGISFSELVVSIAQQTLENTL